MGQHANVLAYKLWMTVLLLALICSTLFSGYLFWLFRADPLAGHQGANFLFWQFVCWAPTALIFFLRPWMNWLIR